MPTPGKALGGTCGERVAQPAAAGPGGHQGAQRQQQERGVGGTTRSRDHYPAIHSEPSLCVTRTTFPRAQGTCNNYPTSHGH